VAAYDFDHEQSSSCRDDREAEAGRGVQPVETSAVNELRPHDRVLCGPVGAEQHRKDLMEHLSPLSVAVPERRGRSPGTVDERLTLVDRL
jgi:hypothetical protein